MSRATVEPDMYIHFENLKDEIFNEINCIKKGKINSFDKTTQAATIEIQTKYQKSETEIINYPLLVDCPVFYLQGGGAYLDLPIEKGDFCLVLFNDYDIDKWFESGNIVEPNSIRKHSLSDGFALVGINPKTKVLDIDGTKVRLMCKNKEFNILNASLIKLLSGTESFIKGTTLATAFNTLCTTIATATSGTTAQNAAGIETIKSAFATFSGQINSFKSTKISGE